MIGIIAIPMVKLTQFKTTEDSPFYNDSELSAMSYASKYVSQGIKCIAHDKNEAADMTNNYKDCENSWLYIFGYTISLFVI